MTNPLLDFSGLPRFDSVLPEHVTPAVTELLTATRALIARLTAETAEATWGNFAAPFFDETERFLRAWGVVSHLHSVNDVPEWREAYNANLPEVSRFFAELGQNLGLFQKFKAIQTSAAYAKLGTAQRKIIDNEVRDFRLSGAELAAEVKPRFQQIQEDLAQCSAKFSENLLDATNAFGEFVEDKALLAGLPDDALEAAKEAAEKDGKTGWKFSLHAPSYMPILQYADNRALREKLYRAYATRAAEFGNPEWDNTALIEKILALRAEEARLLGFSSYAEVSLVPKMAESPAQVTTFLRELAAKARPHAERDLAELRDFASTELGLSELQSWDVAYASEKLRVQRYAFSEQEVKEYFPEPKVLEGLFHVVQTLFGLQIKETNTSSWNSDVRFFSIADSEGQPVGQFYLDLYARDTKRGGAWMDDAITRRRTANGIQHPVAYLNCNFTPPLNGKRAVFTHDEVITLFHEFGHGLHHMLTQIDELGVSGIHGVEWDAVELPSQFMENFCWEWRVLSNMTSHVDTGAPLPRALFDKMLAAKNFQSGLQMLRQIEFSLFDLQLHHDFTPGGKQSVLDLLNTVRAEVAVMTPPTWHRFPNSFSHIFAGGYGAGYFSYKWAEVLSADAYELFEENSQKRASAEGTHGTQGTLDAETGAHFWREILAVGGSRPAIESFTAFRGRPPSVDALLRHNGMIAA